MTTVALVLGHDPRAPSLTELLRIVTALVAADQPVRLVVAAVEGGPDLDTVGAEAATYLDGIAGFGVVPERLDDAGVVAAIAASRDVLCAAPAPRPSRPEVLVVDEAWLSSAREDPGAAVTALRDAGQVLRVAAAPN